MKPVVGFALGWCAQDPRSSSDPFNKYNFFFSFREFKDVLLSQECLSCLQSQMTKKNLAPQHQLNSHFLINSGLCFGQALQ